MLTKNYALKETWKKRIRFAINCKSDLFFRMQDDRLP